MSIFHGLICILWIASMICLIASIPFFILGVCIKIKSKLKDNDRVIALNKYLECVRYCIKNDPAWSFKYLKWCRDK